MRKILAFILLTVSAVAQQLPHEDAIRIAEFYRLSAQIQDQIWPDWSKTPAPLLLVTDKTEFLTHHPSPPKDFAKIGEDVYARPRQFDTHLLATFPVFGPPAVIVIGQAQNTSAKSSTPWLITLMHEHFHQLQNSQSGYFDAVNDLDLKGSDTTGMWMLNYPFPYDRPDVTQSFSQLRDLLLKALAQTDPVEFKKIAAEYVVQRKKVLAQLSANDHKYFSFQLWQEGIARYTQIKAAEAAASYRPTVEYAALPDYESFAAYAARARTETLNELRVADIGKLKRVFVYSFGAAEGLLLDQLNPKWKSEYFKHPLSTDALFEVTNQ
ncbi:MAG: hypothetical protein WBD25_05400 [Terriglobales bacterium]|jgi:hypothetical protein